MGLVLIAMSVRVVVGLILECAFIVGGEVAVAIWALAGWGGDLGKVSKAIGQETSPAEVYHQTKRPVEPLGEHALGVGRLVLEEGAVVRGEDRGDQVGNGVGAGRHSSLLLFVASLLSYRCSPMITFYSIGCEQAELNEPFGPLGATQLLNAFSSKRIAKARELLDQGAAVNQGKSHDGAPLFLLQVSKATPRLRDNLLVVALQRTKRGRIMVKPLFILRLCKHTAARAAEASANERMLRSRRKGGVRCGACQRAGGGGVETIEKGPAKGPPPV